VTTLACPCIYVHQLILFELDILNDIAAIEVFHLLLLVLAAVVTPYRSHTLCIIYLVFLPGLFHIPW